MDGEFVTEIPQALKQLARLVIRGFYTIEHSILVDMLIRHPCMKEDDIVELVKFERKQLRALISGLKSDRFIKVRLRMETGIDGKASRQNYYYINYKVFVNIVKYKLDHMRRKIETEERDSASRASFKCGNCHKTFTDLEADQLVDFATGEDESAIPKQDSRTVVAKFNEQIEPLFVLLREVEDVKLAPALLEPEPTDLSHLKNDNKSKSNNRRGPGDENSWSGEATRNKAFGLENQDVSINFDESRNAKNNPIQKMKELPVSTVNTVDDTMNMNTVPSIINEINKYSSENVITKKKSPPQADIMSVLLAHEKKSEKPVIPGEDEDSDTSESGDEIANNNKFSSALRSVALNFTSLNPYSLPHCNLTAEAAYARHSSSVIKSSLERYILHDSTNVEMMESDDEEEEDIPMISVNGRQVPYTPEMIEEMSAAEKDHYIKVGQEMYANIRLEDDSAS
ncbi:General transcription factor IIE subunit 1 [Nymphon striatum]|nr:General transcription factor IIE subunit 1 [Nymphon striatum]